MQDKRSEAQRRWDMNDALANCKIEGYTPDADALERAERVIRGELTNEQAIEEIKAKYMNSRPGQERFAPEDASMFSSSTEASPVFPLDRVRAALNGEFNAEALTDAEWELFDALIDDAMGEVRTPQERAFLASFEGQPNTDL